MMSDEAFMHRCFDLAQQGSGNVAPNPLVGCVIVSGNKIAGEGFHRQFGKPHAEANAIEDLMKNGCENLLHSSTLYVNLEPCSHYGKTPPCADLIISSGIKKIFVAVKDPFPAVNGSGIEKLRNARVEVITGVLEEEAKFLNRRFLLFI